MTKYTILSYMNTNGVASSILSAVRDDLTDHLVVIAKLPFDGASIHIVEKRFMETIGQSGSLGLSRLFSLNDESRKTAIVDGQKHYRKYDATGRHLTLLGEISLKRGIYQSNIAASSICPLELKLGFINAHCIGVWGGLRYPPKEADMKRLCNQLS